MRAADENATVAVACSLTTKQAATQVVEWTDLQHVATSVTAIEGGASMTFPSSIAAQVQDLADREQACCAFLELSTLISGQTLTLNVTSRNPDAQPVIAMLAGIPLPGAHPV